MKKKIVAMMALVSMVSALVVGCGSAKLQNEHIVIKQYKGLEVLEVNPREITDEDVERDIENQRDQRSTFHEITDRPAQEGDTVRIDFKGLHNGVAFEGGEQEGAELIIGNGGYIEGFQEGIIGHNPGDEFEVDVVFPDPYPQDPDLAGQPAVFEMTLHAISEKELPELDDELVAQVSETATTVEEWKEEVKQQLTENAEADAKRELENALGMVLQENIEIKKLPEDALDERKRELREKTEQQAAMYQMEFKEFIELAYQVDEEAFEELVNEEAEKMISMEIAIELIAEKEKLIPTEAEIAEKTEEYVEMYAFENAEAFIEQAGEDYVRDALIHEGVAGVLVEHAKQIPADEWEKREAEKAENTEEVTEEESTDEPVDEEAAAEEETTDDGGAEAEANTEETEENTEE